MILITGTIKVETAAELERVKDALIRRAKRSRQDTGNIDYVFSTSLEDPLEVRLDWSGAERRLLGERGDLDTCARRLDSDFEDRRTLESNRPGVGCAAGDDDYFASQARGREVGLHEQLDPTRSHALELEAPPLQLVGNLSVLSGYLQEGVALCHDGVVSWARYIASTKSW